MEPLLLLADRCVEMTGAVAVGLLPASPGGEPRVVASSSEAMRVVEEFQAESAQDRARTATAAANRRSASTSTALRARGPISPP